MSGVCRVFNVGDVDGDSSCLFFGRIVNIGIRFRLGQGLVRKHSSDGSRQGGFSVVHVTDGAHIAMGLVSQENFLLGGDCIKPLECDYRGCPVVANFIGLKIGFA